MAIELFQFPGSHFNEKARWGLDWKGVAHERISLMPGPHMRTVKKLTGRTQTPVLRDDGRVIDGSTAILEHLEQRFPEPALFPTDAAARERALTIVRRFDDEVGPAVRLAKFFEVMEADYAVQTSCRDQGALARGLYRAAFPMIGRVMRSSMQITAENAERAREITREAFDFVAKAWLARWADHPGAAWVRETYRRYRTPAR
jgi:glutathione S-transferase